MTHTKNKFIVKNLKIKTAHPDDFTGEFFQILTEKSNVNYIQILSNNRKRGEFSTSFNENSLIMIPRIYRKVPEQAYSLLLK